MQPQIKINLFSKQLKFCHCCQQIIVGNSNDLCEIIVNCNLSQWYCIVNSNTNEYICSEWLEYDLFMLVILINTIFTEWSLCTEVLLCFTSGKNFKNEFKILFRFFGILVIFIFSEHDVPLDIEQINQELMQRNEVNLIHI